MLNMLLILPIGITFKYVYPIGVFMRSNGFNYT